MKYPPWQPMETAPKDRDILAIWAFTHPSDEQFNCQQIGIASFNGIFEEHHPGSGFWNGWVHGGHVTTRSNYYKPIAWMELPSIDLQ